MDTPQPLQIDDVIIGEYRILDIFGGEGKSGMGVVYLVEDRDHPFPIVLKTFQKSDLDSTSRFRLEAQAWISLGIHPNIVQAFFVREINEQLFIGAEYIGPDDYGRNTVTDYIEQGGVSDLFAIKWTAQFCYAMDFALSKGLTAHRDIKPDNLMIDRSGNLKVTDFGLAKSLNNIDFISTNGLQTLNVNLTRADSFLGTVLFASPEQIFDSSSVDFRSDIYSFGITLYQLISSNGFPYSLKGKTTLEEIAMMHLQEPLIQVKHPLFGIAEKCLAKDPNRRFQSYQELLDELTVTAKGLGVKMPSIRIEADAELRELYIQSLSFLELGEKDKALELIEKYIERDELDSSSWSLKGRILFETGKAQEGINATLRSLELDPYNSHTLNNLGVFYGETGEHDKEEYYLSEAICVDAYNVGAVMNLATALDKRGLYVEAAEAILKALDLAPDKKTLHFNASNIAASVTRSGQGETARRILETLIQLDPANSNNWFNLGICHQSANQKEQAIECYKTVLELSPLDEQTLIFLSQLNAELGNFDEALRYCEIMLDNGVALTAAVCCKAQVLQAKGLKRDSINFVEQVLNCGHQNNDSLWMLLGNLFENESQYAAATDCYLRAKSILSLQEEVDEENLAFIERKLNRTESLQKYTPAELLNLLTKVQDGKV